MPLLRTCLSILVVTSLLFSASLPARAATTWQSPPDPIGRIIDAPRPPAVSFSPDHAWLAELNRPSLPPLSDLAAPIVPIAGTRIDPRTNGPAREYAYTSLSVRPMEGGKARHVELPAGAGLRNLSWAADRPRLSFTLTREEGIELWVLDVPDGEPRRLTGPVLNAAFGAPCTWLPGDEGFICKLIDEKRGAPPEADPVPSGPIVSESSGRKAAARTYTNLLKSPLDEALLEYYMGSAVVQVALDGTKTELKSPALVEDVLVSPDGRFLLVETIHRPFSYSVPRSRFPLRSEVLDRKGASVQVVADLPLADDIPIRFGSTRKGRRGIAWRNDKPSTLYWVEALDGGDAGKSASKRDALRELAAPFKGEAKTLWESEYRFGGVRWGNENVAVASEWWYDNRKARSWAIDPSDASAKPSLIEDRNYQDAYADPGDPVMERGDYGRSVMKLTADGKGIYLTGRGASDKGVYPFLDKMEIATGEAKRLWSSKDPYYETVVDVLDAKARKLITRRQSNDEPANYFLTRRGSGRPVQLTHAVDHAPELAGLHKELLTYERNDGVKLSATLYLPPGYQAKRDGPLPTVFWAYPREHKSKKTASQVTSSENTFSRPGGSSVLFMLTQGYAVLQGPTMPIVGEGDQEPNDTFIDQLVASAEAAVEKVVSMGVADRDRIAIGGHSYGAFTVVHLLAHTDIFRAGIARSGAYNRTLTPFGFQGEQRTFWQATDTYIELSPFSHAAKVNEPLLMTHGGEDSNSGTYPIQSERLYGAIKGLGGTVRWVVLPHEDHGYRSREAVGHVLWEMSEWLDQHVKNAPSRAASVGF